MGFRNQKKGEGGAVALLLLLGIIALGYILFTGKLQIPNFELPSLGVGGCATPECAAEKFLRNIFDDLEKAIEYTTYRFDNIDDIEQLQSFKETWNLKEEGYTLSSLKIIKVEKISADQAKAPLKETVDDAAQVTVEYEVTGPKKFQKTVELVVFQIKGSWYVGDLRQFNNH